MQVPGPAELVQEPRACGVSVWEDQQSEDQARSGGQGDRGDVEVRSEQRQNHEEDLMGRRGFVYESLKTIREDYLEDYCSKEEAVERLIEGGKAWSKEEAEEIVEKWDKGIEDDEDDEVEEWDDEE